VVRGGLMENKEGKRPVWHGRAFDFDEEVITLPNGKRIVAGVIKHSGSSAIVPVREDGSVVMIEQYRPAIRDFVWEIPAGCMDPGEDPLTCAKRELQEETGYAGNRFQKVGEIWVAPGYSTECIHLFLATELMPSESHLDEDELLSVHFFPFLKALEMVARNEIKDAMTMIALQMAYPVWNGIIGSSA
jgi:ADP-ribose pyrophosphatase